MALHVTVRQMHVIDTVIRRNLTHVAMAAFHCLKIATNLMALLALIQTTIGITTLGSKYKVSGACARQKKKKKKVKVKEKEEEGLFISHHA